MTARSLARVAIHSVRVPAVHLTIALALSLAPHALGQQTSESLLQEQRRIDDQLRRERQQLSPLDAWADWQWGGWLEYYAFHFDDGVQSQRVLQRPGSAVWTRLRLDGGAHEVFARMRLRFEYFNPGDEYSRQQDWIGPSFDRVWYGVDVGRALRLTEPDDPLQMQVRVGRQDVLFGTGYALDLPLDAVMWTIKAYDWSVTGLAGRTLPSLPNIDRSDAVDSHSHRRMYGVQVNYDAIEKHRPFAYALWNDDATDERPKDWLQNYAYDTQYFGIGSRGELARNLGYWTEVVYESGLSYGDGDFRSRDRVDAWGFDVGLEYLWDVVQRPRASFEYMFASGDADRVFNATGAQGGNARDRDDTGFVAFGYRDTGLAAAPALSNVHIWRGGAAAAPLASVEYFRDFELGTNWFLYHKHQARGAISDGTADEFEGFLGWEMDYFLNWRLSSDLSWTLRWGAFFPGDAFSDQSMRSFLVTGLTWSF